MTANYSDCTLPLPPPFTAVAIDRHDRIKWHEKKLARNTTTVNNVTSTVNRKKKVNDELWRIFLVFIFVVNNRVSGNYAASSHNAEESPVFYEINRVNVHNHTHQLHHNQQQQQQQQHQHRGQHHSHNKQHKHVKQPVTERCHLIPTKEQVSFWTLIFSFYFYCKLTSNAKRVFFSTPDCETHPSHSIIYFERL